MEEPSSPAPDTQVTSGKSRGASRTWYFWLAIIGLLIITLSLWQAMRLREDTGRQDKLRQFNENVFISLQNSLANLNETMYWNESILLANGDVSREKFSALNNSLVERNHAVLQVQWVPWVKANERTAFEARAHRDGLKDFSFVQPDADGKLISSPPAEDYVVVYYAVARPNIDTSVGLNVIFTPERRVVYDKSANTGEFFNTGVLKLYTSTRNTRDGSKFWRPGFVIGRPVYDLQSSNRLKGKRVNSEGLRGWIVLVVTLDELFAASVDQYLTSEFDIILFQEDEHGRKVIGERSIAGGKRALVPEKYFQENNDDLIKTFQVADKTFGVAIQPTSVWNINKSRIGSTVTLLGGLVFTAFLAYFFYLQIKHGKREEKMNARIHAREALLHDMTANVTVAVYQAQKKQSGKVCVNYVSEPVFQLLGVTVDEVIADPAACYRNVVAEDTPAPLGAIVLADPQSANSESFRVRLPHGERWIEHRALHREPKGDGYYIINGYWADITELKRKEMEIECAKGEAERANRAKSAFLSNMSHELRTPLNAILGFSRILERDREMGVESQKKLAMINRAGQHLLGLINDVLDISRIEAGRIVIQKSPFDLMELIMAVEEIIRARAEVKGLAFHAEHTPGLPLYVEGDGPHLKQVLINLLGNAVKYTAQGSVHHRVSRRNGEIVFEVSDTGCGISEEDQKNLFQAFYQTDSAISQGEGTGLGLAISLEYTRHMGGKIEVSSQMGKGSIFTLNMPLPETSLSVARQSRNQLIRLEEGHGSVRVLVVDDKEDNRELAKALLEEAGFEIRTAENGQQAVELFQSWQPRMILMDMRMPVLDGYEATRQIRRLPGGGKVKIVALTASAFEEDRQRVMNAGCEDMARKPIEEEKLFAIMGKLLELHYRKNEAVASPESSTIGIKLNIKVLPFQVVKKLREAADALDLESAQQIVKQLEVSYPELAAALETLIERFRFDQIADLCKAAEGEQ